MKIKLPENQTSFTLQSAMVVRVNDNKCNECLSWLSLLRCPENNRKRIREGYRKDTDDEGKVR